MRCHTCITGGKKPRKAKSVFRARQFTRYTRAWLDFRPICVLTPIQTQFTRNRRDGMLKSIRYVYLTRGSHVIGYPPGSIYRGGLTRLCETRS